LFISCFPPINKQTDTLRVRGSVIPSVISDVILITAFAASLLAVEKSDILGGRSLNVASVIGKLMLKARL
jgi:predicted membrane chloride channel (bestrophin family)